MNVHIYYLRERPTCFSEGKTTVHLLCDDCFALIEPLVVPYKHGYGYKKEGQVNTVCERCGNE